MSKITKFQIDIRRIEHRGAARILLLFPYDAQLIDRIKEIEGRKYTKTYKGWHLPYEVNSLIKIADLNIDINIKESDQNDPVFSQFEERIRIVLNPQCQSDRFERKAAFLIDTLILAYIEELKTYIYYLKEEGYSWKGIKGFTQFASAYLEGKAKVFKLNCTYDLESTDYIRMQNVFLEFRNRK